MGGKWGGVGRWEVGRGGVGEKWGGVGVGGGSQWLVE